MIKNKKAFSFVELIVVLAILLLLWVLWVSLYSSSNDKTNNSKVISWAKTLKNALSNYLQDNKILPLPDWNKNYFKIDSSYAHYDDDNTFWVYGSITEKTLPKKYIDILPLDPVSNHYYSYWKTLDNKYFEVSSILRQEWDAIAKLDWTYPWENWPVSLIREYNWPYFVQDKSHHLPYNPDEHILVAQIFSHWNNVKVNGLVLGSWSTKQIRTGDEIEVKSWEKADIYFADGSVSIIWDNSKDTKLTLSNLDYKDEKDNLFTKVQLYLSVGSIFTQATALNQNWEGSDFEIYTQDTTAAVRWTEFLVSYDNNQTSLIVVNWEVIVKKTENTKENLHPIMPWDEIERVMKNGKIILTSEGFEKWKIWEEEVGEIEDEYKTNIIDDNIPNWQPEYILYEDFSNPEKFEAKKQDWTFSGFTIKDWYLHTDIPWWFLEYKNLNFWDNFTIEMSVRFPEINIGWTRYLFQLGDYKLWIKNNWKIILSNTNNTWDININFDWDFHIIKAEKKLNNYTLYIDWEKKWDFISDDSIWSNLYIWSSETKEYQFNDIINYVKIYIKK